jgi:hypothetical protein
MKTRHSLTFSSLIVAAACLAACYLVSTASAETPSASKTSKAVEDAKAAAKKATDASRMSGAATITAEMYEYPDNADGSAAHQADDNAYNRDGDAEDAGKKAAEARDKACQSGKKEDAEAADKAEQEARDAEARANQADAAADAADRKADPFGKQENKKDRDAKRAKRAALRAARAAICFARQCAELMDESSEQNKKKKNDAIETIDGLGSSVNQLAFAPLQRGATGEVKTAGGLTTVTFETLQGRVIVNLPDDRRAGDTISGTVIGVPKENMSMGDQKIKIATAKNPDGTSDVNVEVPVTATASPFTITLPPSIPTTPPLKSVSSGSSGGLGITLTNTSGSLTVGRTTIVPIEIVSLSLQSAEPLKVPQLPTIGQQGRPIEIYGPFDGNSKNTVLHFTGAPILVNGRIPENETKGAGTNLTSVYMIAESPRKCVFEAPTNVTGPIELYLKEGDNETKGTYRNVGVNLTAPKTSLLKGESTELHVEVNGLQGLTQPVPLTIESHGVITMVGGNYQPLVIQPSQVGADGRYSTTRGITGVQTGGWTATATVVTHKFDVCLQDDTAPARRILWNTFNGDYIFSCPVCWPPAGPAGGSSGKPTDQTTTGKGTITMKGCIFTLEHNAPDRRVMSTIDQCTNTGSATVQTAAPKMKFTITDRNTTDNTCAVP